MEWHCIGSLVENVDTGRIVVEFAYMTEEFRSTYMSDASPIVKFTEIRVRRPTTFDLAV